MSVRMAMRFVVPWFTCSVDDGEVDMDLVEEALEELSEVEWSGTPETGGGFCLRDLDRSEDVIHVRFGSPRLFHTDVVFRDNGGFSVRFKDVEIPSVFRVLRDMANDGYDWPSLVSFLGYMWVAADDEGWDVETSKGGYSEKVSSSNSPVDLFGVRKDIEIGISTGSGAVTFSSILRGPEGSQHAVEILSAVLPYADIEGIADIDVVAVPVKGLREMPDRVIPLPEPLVVSRRESGQVRFLMHDVPLSKLNVVLPKVLDATADPESYLDDVGYTAVYAQIQVSGSALYRALLRKEGDRYTFDPLPGFSGMYDQEVNVYMQNYLNGPVRSYSTKVSGRAEFDKFLSDSAEAFVKEVKDAVL